MSDKVDALDLELAQRRLAADMDSGMRLSHDWVLKPCKGKDWREKHWDFEKKIFIDDGPARFNYCDECKNWAWALGDICPTRYRAALQERVTDLVPTDSEANTNLSEESR